MMVIKLKHALLSLFLLAFAGSWSEAIAGPLPRTATRYAPPRTVAPGSVAAKTSHRAAKRARPVPPPATATTTTIGASQTTITLGDTVTFTAKVTGVGTPTGLVLFFDGPTPLGSGILNGAVGNDQAMLSTSLLAASTSPHNINAVYEGDASNTSSTSAPVIVTVQTRTSTTGVVLNPTTVVVGQPTTATVTLTDAGSVPPGTPDVFAATGAPATGRTGFGATLFADGLVLIAGGTDATGVVLQSAEIYSVSGAAFTAAGNLNTARTGAIALLLPNGKVLIAGGSSDGTANGALNSAELFDPTTGTFTPTGQNMTAARFAMSAVFLNTGLVLLAGGQDAGGVLNSAELYNPFTDTFTATGNLNTARTGAGAVLLGVTPTEKALIVGGSSDGTANGALNTGELFDPNGNAGAGSFTPIVSLLSNGRWQPEVAYVDLLSEKVLVGGGQNAGGALASADIYDPVGNTFTASAGTMAVARANGSAITLPNGTVLLAGGTASTTVEFYDSESDRFDSTASLQQSDNGLISILLNNGQVLVVGLTSSVTPAADAELYAPSFNPLGSVVLGSSEATDAFGTPCVLVPSAATASTCTSTDTPANVAASPHTITGTYSADGVHATSNNTASLTVNLADTTTAVTSSANPSVFGQSVTFTATVSPVAPGAGTATGTVAFLDGGSSIGTGNLAAGVATFATSALAIGGHTITTSYGGDGNFNGSTGSLTGNPQVVNKADTSTAVTSSANPSVLGQSVTFTATVSTTAPGAGTATGTVTFLDGGSTVGTGNLSGGVATFATSALAIGNHTITTSYGGDGNFDGSTGSLTGNPQVVGKANTATAVTSSANPSVFGQSVTFTATVSAVAPGAGTPTGTVTFLDSGTSIGTGNLTAGVATLATAALVPGNHTITTTFGGDASFNTSTGSLTGNPQVVNKANTATAVTSSLNPSVFGQSVTFTATVSATAPGAGTATGTMTFLDGGSTIGSGNLSAGVATFTTSALAGGNHTITTSYGGDGNFNGSTGSLTGNPQVVNKANTTTALTSSVNPSVFGQSVTFTATLSAVAPGAGTSTGTVTFLDGGSSIGTGNLAAGVATFTTSALAIGNHTITTSYGGDGNFNGSTGSLTGNPQVVNKASTNTAVTSSANPSLFGQSVTFTATVSAVAPGAGTATGTVTFLDGGSSIGTGNLSAGGVATFTTSALAVGNHTITTAYGGDASFNGSAGSLTGNPQVVNKANSTTAVTSSANPSVFGQSVTLTATVTAVAPGTGTPTGTVTFLDGGASIGTGNLAAGVATLATAALAPGNHTITATYGGDASFNASTGSLAGNPQVVNKANTTTALTSSLNPSVFGQSVTFTATVSPVAPGAGTPTGTVTFLDGGTSIGTGNLSAGGVATLATSALAGGNHTITTTYGGDASFNGSAGSLTGNPQVVDKANTTTAVTSSANPSVFGQSVTFTATVSAVAPGAGTPTGTVTFLDGGTSIGTGNLAAGVATLATAALAPGNHTITTTYGGDASFNTSAGSLTGNPQVVGKANTATAVTSSANPSVFGQSVTFTATVSAVAPGAGTPTGTVTFLDGGASIGTGTLNGAGVATLATSALALGNHTITTTYSGDGNFNTSAGSLTGNPQVVGKANTATAVTSSTNPSVFGQSVTFTATVSAVAPGAGTPTGTVTFLDGGTSIGTGNLAAGVATFATAALAGGNHTITTTYGGDTNFNGGAGSLTGNPQVVNKANSATAVTSSANPAVFGQSVTFTATVSAVAPAAGTPTGTVTFLDGGSSIGTGNLSAGGVATFTTLALAGGNHTITTTYGGDTNFSGSTGSLTGNPQVVNQASSTTAVTSSLNPSSFGQSVTFTAAVAAVAPGAGTATGTVTFLDGGTSIGTGTLAAGVATLTTSALATGNHTITATYGGDGNFTASTGSLTGNPQVVNKGSSTTALTSSLNPSLFGQSVTFTATVTAVAPATGTPTGTVTFLDGGDTTFNTSTGSLTGNPQVVNKASTTTAVTSSVNPSTFGQSVTLTATVAAVAPGAGTATGTVTFLDGGTSIGTGTLAAGVATFATSTLAGGNHTITATYGGDASFATSTGSLTGNPQVVNPAASMTALTAAPNPSVFGQSVTLTATVTSGVTGTPTGTVTFKSNGATVGAAVALNGSGVATLSTAALAVGPQNLTAVYSGDADFATSTSTAVSFTVNQGATSTALTAAPNPATSAQTVTLTATVAATAPGAGTPTGTVTFKNGANTIGAPVALAGGTAVLMTTLPPGVLSITAVYSGDADFLTSTSAAQSVTITTSTTTTLAGAPNPSTFGQSVTLTATITPTPTGASLGTVNFFNGATNIGTGNVSASGVATLATTTLPVGSLTLTATYSGNVAFGTSTSAPFTQTVNVAPTTTVLAASPSPATFGQSVTLTATITPAPTGASLGTVTFANGGATLGTATPNSSGVATLATTTLPAGALTLTAAYSGNASFGASTSAGLALTVNTTFAVMVAQTSFTVGQGGSVMIPVNIPPQGGAFNNLITMSATGLPPASTGTFVPPSVTPGAAAATTVLTIQLAPLAAGLTRPAPSSPGSPVPAFAVAAGLLLFVRRSHLRRSLRLAGFLIAATFLAAGLAGCSGGFLRPPSTPPGNFTVTITGTSGATMNSATVTVVVR